MAIKGVSEVVRLPRLGKIRLGIMKENDEGTPYPQPTDHFVCPEAVRRLFGDRPKRLRVMFPTEDSRQWASQHLKCYSASRQLVCRGDGEMAVARIDLASGELATHDPLATELRETGCRPETCRHYQEKHCRRVMSLQFLLPDCPGFGVYQLDTSSFYSIVNVNSALELIRGVCGRVAMIPLSLRLVEQDVQPDGLHKRAHVLSLTAPHTLVGIQKYAQVPPGRALLELPPPDGEAPDDLFPDEVLGAERSGPKACGPAADAELLQLWDRARRRVRQVEAQDFQIADWFQRSYGVDVGLGDFEASLPPCRIKVGHLSGFLDALDRHCDRA